MKPRYRRDGGNDRACVLENIELQRDRGSDHGVLPLEWNGQRAHPFAPVRRGLGQEAPAHLVGAVLQRFVRPEHERDGVVEEKGALLENRRDGHVARQPQHERVADVPDVIAAGGRTAERLAVVLRRPRAHANARVPRDTLDAPHQHHRTEDPAVVLESRREIADLDDPARGVGHARDDDGRVVQVSLLGRDPVEQLNAKEADVGARLEQRAEHRIPVEPGETGPGDLASGIDEGADRPVADER